MRSGGSEIRSEEALLPSSASMSLIGTFVGFRRLPGRQVRFGVPKTGWRETLRTEMHSNVARGDDVTKPTCPIG